MERMPLLDEAITRAGQGDATAAGAVLLQLAGKNAQDQIAALQALHRVANVSFWRHLLDYLSTGSWSGRAVGQEDLALWQALQPRIHALFLNSALEEPAKRARHQALLAGLAGEQPQVRAISLEIVAGLGSTEGLQSIVAALQSEQRNVRLQAARALAHLRDTRAVPALVETLASDDGILAGLAKDALVETGHPATSALGDLLENRHARAQARWLAARAMERIADPSGIPALAGCLDDPDFGIRWAAAHGLAALKTSGYEAVLRALIAKPMNPWLCDSALAVLRHVPSELAAVVKPVVSALQSVDFQWETPVAAHKALEDLASNASS